MLTVRPVAPVKMPTFITSPDQPRTLSVHRHHSGFTLIELLVVLAIAGLLVALVPLAYSKARDSVQYRSTLRTMVGDIRLARQSALSKGLTSFFFVDLKQRKYGFTGATSRSLPESLQVKVIVGSEQLQPDGMGSIEFLPDGGATGGSIEVVRANGEGTRVRVDWFSGQVSLERLLQ